MNEIDIDRYVKVHMAHESQMEFAPRDKTHVSFMTTGFVEGFPRIIRRSRKKGLDGKLKIENSHREHPIMNMLRHDMFTFWRHEDILDEAVYRFLDYGGGGIIVEEHKLGEQNDEILEIDGLPAGLFQPIYPSYYNRREEKDKEREMLRRHGELKERERATHAYYLGRNLRNDIDS